MAAYLLTQDREILAKSRPISGLGGNLVHVIICLHARLRATLFRARDEKLIL